MAIITEDHVSFETAKLLKEKGFDEYCFCINYPAEEGNHNIILPSCISNSTILFADEYKFCRYKEDLITIPTLQMAMKWLRKVHNIYIDISPTYSEVEKTIHFIWQIFDSNYDGVCDCEIFYDKYETACEESIKYCLENLI